MLSQFKNQLLSDFPNLGDDYTLYLATSGGKDSMVLSHLLLSLGYEYTMLHCNFQLRGKESDEDEKFLLSFAKENHILIQVEKLDTYSWMEETGLGVQEAARELRYNWFGSFAKNKRILILTAHHLDDSIETFFINLLRGTGHRGVRGIPKFNAPFYRPLLNFSVDEIYKYVDEYNLPYREDSSNAENKYLRNKIRHSVIPLLLDLEPNFKSKMGSFFSEMENTGELIESISNEWSEKYIVQQDHAQVNLKVIENSSKPLIQHAFNQYGIRRSNVNQFIKFISSSKGAKFYTDSHKFLIDRESLFIKNRSDFHIEVQEVVSTFPYQISTALGILRFEIKANEEIHFSDNPLHLDFDRLKLPLTIRNWENGDKINPLGMNGWKLISDILIDKKISQFDKENILVIEDANLNIVGVLNYLISDRWKVKETSTQVLRISLTS